MNSEETVKRHQLSEKIQRYETFVNDRLKPDLKNLLEERDGIYNEIAEFIALRNTIHGIKLSELGPGEPLKTRVDLGCNFYCDGQIEDPSKIFVDIGMGFYLEFTLEEAEEFINKKVKGLEDKGQDLTNQANKIKANIKLVLEGLREIQNLPKEDIKKSNYDPLS